jgi:hypothetical protein
VNTLIPLELVMKVYEEAVEKTCPAAHGRDWWLQVQREITAVVAAKTNRDAAEVIDWWHHNWRDFNDTPTRAAGRIRRVAARLMR